MRRIVVIAGVLAGIALLADTKPADEPAKPEALTIQPQEAMDDLKEVGEEANEAVEKIIPDEPDVAGDDQA